MVEKILDLMKFLFTTIPGCIILFSIMFLSWALTGSFNPFYILWFIYKKVFVWK